ncbi:MAG: hypothetical protein H0X24_02235 [Ktedonobacterales bacterium]|nr:hypothetical protein [Ktedonobacterales bacterium]
MADLMLRVFPRMIADVGNGATLTQFLDAAVRQGYAILPADALPLLRELQTAGTLGTLRPGIHADAQPALAAYVQGTSDTFDCSFRFTAPPDQDYGLLFDMTLTRKGHILFGVNDNTFKYNEYGLRNYERFLEFVTLVYGTWPPLYGYLSADAAWDQEEVRALQANSLCELTLFGPEYVNKIGRDKFHAAHVWRKMSMKDGGYILDMGSFAQYTQPNMDVHPHEVADLLGLDAAEFMD